MGWETLLWSIGSVVAGGFLVWVSQKFSEPWRQILLWLGIALVLGGLFLVVASIIALINTTIEVIEQL